MNMLRHAKPPAVFLALGLIVAACGGGLYAQYPIVTFGAPNNALITFDSPILDDADVIRVHDREALEYVEYARFETEKLTLEAVYDIALNDSIVLEYDYTLKQMIETWNANIDEDKTWGTRSSVWAWHGKVQYQLYRLTESGSECAGFSSEWNFQPQDPFGRPGKVFFGYICGESGSKLPQPEIVKLLENVKISRRDGSSFVPVGSRRSVDQKAFDTAKGSPDEGSGNSKFPFNFGRVYTEGEGRRSP